MIACRLIRLPLLLLACFSMVRLGGAAPERSGLAEQYFQEKFDEADSIHTAGHFDQAEAKYKAILAEYPDSQRIALRIAIVQGKQGRTDEAIESYQSAYAMNNDGAWADVALFYAARFAQESGRQSEAVAFVDECALNFPESPWTTRCEQLDSRQQLSDSQKQSLKQRLEQDIQIAERVDAIVDNVSMEDLAKVRQLSEEYEAASSSRLRLRILERIGHIQARSGDATGAKKTFLLLRSQIPEGSVSSRISKTCLRRLAALSQVLGDPEAAVAYYDQLSSLPCSEDALEDIRLQRTGALFEIIQKEFRAGGNGYSGISQEQWKVLEDQLDGLLQDVVDDSRRATATLMRLEVHSWKGEAADAKALCEDLSRSATASKQVKTTALFFVGDLLALQGRNSEAIPFLQAVVDEPANETLWPNMDHYSRACYRLAVVYHAIGDRASFGRVLRILETKYPDLDYTKLAKELAS